MYAVEEIEDRKTYCVCQEQCNRIGSLGTREVVIISKQLDLKYIEG